MSDLEIERDRLKAELDKAKARLKELEGEVGKRKSELARQIHISHSLQFELDETKTFLANQDATAGMLRQELRSCKTVLAAARVEIEKCEEECRLRSKITRYMITTNTQSTVKQLLGNILIAEWTIEPYKGHLILLEGSMATVEKVGIPAKVLMVGTQFEHKEDVKIGSTVLVSKYLGTIIDKMKENVRIYDAEDVLGVIT